MDNEALLAGEPTSNLRGRGKSLAAPKQQPSLARRVSVTTHDWASTQLRSTPCRNATSSADQRLDTTNTNRRCLRVLYCSSDS
jgi:hypothetical protein